MSTYIESPLDSFDNPDCLSYIVNLTTTLIGKSALDELKATGGNLAKNGKALRKVLLPILAPKVAKMNSETLGKICSFGTLNGVHPFYDCRTHPPKFINQTGINDVCDFKFKPRSLEVGRQAIEEIATMVIVSFALDIMFQSEWVKAWDKADDEHMEDVRRGRDWKYGL
jgi:hypothetical protein